MFPSAGIAIIINGFVKCLIGNYYDKENSLSEFQNLSHLADNPSRTLVFESISMLGSFLSSRLSLRSEIMSFSMSLKLNVSTLSLFDCCLASLMKKEKFFSCNWVFILMSLLDTVTREY